MDPSVVHAALAQNQSLQSAIQRSIDGLDESLRRLDEDILREREVLFAESKPKRRKRSRPDTYLIDPVSGATPPPCAATLARAKVRASVQPCVSEAAQPSAEHTPAQSWSVAEESNLVQSVKAHGCHDWRAIAAEAGNGRSTKAVFQHYQQRLNPHLCRGAWSAEEDALLSEAVRAYGSSTRSWGLIADCFDGRTSSQCRERWSKSIEPGLCKGRWSDREERVLFLAVRAHGERFSEAARHVPGRTGPQGREKWTNVLAPDVKRDGWSESEDEALEEAVEAHGCGNWSHVAQSVAGRTDDQCKRRWKQLRKSDAAEYEQVRVLSISDEHGQQMLALLRSHLLYIYIYSVL